VRLPVPGRWYRLLLALLVVCASRAALAPAPAAAASAPAAAAAAEWRESAHFTYRYDPARLPSSAVDTAIAAAEAGYARCAGSFPAGGLQRRIEVDLTPSFLGAAGVADPPRYAVSIRVPDLDYLGLDIRYVMAHEVAHVFTYAELSARGAGRGGTTGPWGEGMADFTVGGFGNIPLADWWGRAFRASGLWTDPQWLVDGSTGPRDGDFVRERACSYDQAALFIRYLVGEYGREAFGSFYADYSTAAARQREARRRSRRPPSDADPGASDAPSGSAALDAVFRAHFGAGGEELLTRWRERLDAAEVPAEPALRLALHQHIYGSLREFEMRYQRQARRGNADETAAAATREEFRQANRCLRSGDLRAAADHLQRARELARLRAPQPGPVAALWWGGE